MLPCLRRWFIFAENRTFCCNAACNLRTSRLGEGCTCGIFTLTPAWRQGNGVQGVLQGAGGMGCMCFATTGTLCEKVMETWPASKIWYSEYPLPFPTWAVVWGHPLAEHKAYPSFSSNTLVCVLFIVNSGWGRRTFTHLCRIYSNFTRRTSFISRAAQSCWAQNWFPQPLRLGRYC